jgi:Flp pilus assembly protein TadG
MNSEGSNWRRSKMRVFPHKTHRTSNGDAMLARTLTFWQKLRAFVGVKEEGSQLVEMAVVAPLLLIILTGMASFGIAVYSQQQLGLAASQASLPQWSAANISYNLTIYTGNTTTPSVTTGTLKGAAFTCISDNADLTQFQPIVLTVSYPYTWFPIMGWAKYGTGASPSTPTGSLTTTQAAMVQ